MIPRLVVETQPVQASAVFVRPTGTDGWRSVADHTPVALELTDGRYDLRVEAPDGPFLRYRGEVTGVRPGYDHPVIDMQREVYRPTVLPLGVALAAGLLAVAWRRIRQMPRAVTRPRPATSAPPEERVLPPLEGVTVQTEDGARFDLHAELGRGEMGVVLDATRGPGDPRRYAVKILRQVKTDRTRRRFEREIRLCTRLRHPNIVEILGAGVYPAPDGYLWPFMVMELLIGTTLRARLREGHPELLDAVWWILEILRGLHAAHQSGIIHRDLKPENIMLTYDGRIKVMDFGVACQLGENDLTRTGQALGTPVYMSPEHLDAKGTTAASDVYSLGVIFYEALTGAYPHEAAEVWGLIGKKMTEPAIHILQHRPDLDRELCRIVMGMLLTSPEKRYGSAAAVLADLEPWAQRAGL